MPTQKKAPRVHLRWLNRTEGGLRYAILRWSTPEGRPSQTLGFVSEREAEDARRDREAALRLGVSLPNTNEPAPPTVDDLVESYLQALEEGAGRGSLSYRRHELLHCKRLGEHLGKIRAERLTEAHVRRLVQTLIGEQVEIPTDPKERRHRLRGMKRKSSINDLLGCLRRVYREGRSQGLVDIEAPTIPTKALSEDSRPARQLTEAEVAKLIEAAASEVSPAFGRLVAFLAWCPRRPVAVFALRRQDCTRILDHDLPRAKVLLYFDRDKAGIGRGWCPLTGPALDVLRDHLATLPEDGAPESLIWTSSTGRPWSTSLIAPPFRRAVAAAGLTDVLPYDLRKFGASVVYARASGNLKVVQEFTGHADVQQLLKRYVSAPRGAAEELASLVTWTPAPLRLVGVEEN